MGLSLCLGLLLKTKGFGVTPNKTKKLTKKKLKLLDFVITANTTKPLVS